MREDKVCSPIDYIFDSKIPQYFRMKQISCRVSEVGMDMAPKEMRVNSAVPNLREENSK